MLALMMLCMAFVGCKKEAAYTESQQSDVVSINSDNTSGSDASVDDNISSEDTSSEPSNETTDVESDVSSESSDIDVSSDVSDETTDTDVSTDVSNDTSDESSDIENSEPVVSEPETSDPDEHTHDFKVVKVKEATCTMGGATYYECDCGEEKREASTALGHKDGEWVVIVEATTEHNGTKYLYCARCDEKIDEKSIPKLDEQGSEDNSDSNSGTHVHGTQEIVVDPTCTEEGYTYIECKECGIYSKYRIVDALGHKNSSPWVTVKEATDKEDGLKEQHCDRCGVLMGSEVIPKLDKYSVIATAENTYLVEERILYYINQYRVPEGACAMTLTNKYDANGNPTNKSGKFARGRALQLVTNYAHDVEDTRELATELQFGYYVPEQPEAYFDFETEELIYTGNMIPAYYQPPGSEAIGKTNFTTATVDQVARSVARMFYDSKAHWDYIGKNENEYIAIGVEKIENMVYICLFAMSSNKYD